MKIDTLNLRVSPSFKLALKAAADHERRSMVNMLEVLVADYCDAMGLSIPDQPSVSGHPASSSTPTSRTKQ